MFQIALCCQEFAYFSNCPIPISRRHQSQVSIFFPLRQYKSPKIYKALTQHLITLPSHKPATDPHIIATKALEQSNTHNSPLRLPLITPHLVKVAKLLIGDCGDRLLNSPTNNAPNGSQNCGKQNSSVKMVVGGALNDLKGVGRE